MHKNRHNTLKQQQIAKDATSVDNQKSGTGTLWTNWTVFFPCVGMECVYSFQISIN